MCLVFFEIIPIKYQFNVCFEIMVNICHNYQQCVGSTLTMVVRLAGVQIQKQ